MKKSKFLFWAMLLLVAAACGTSSPPEIANVPVVTPEDCALSISINGEKMLAPKETARLAVNQVGFDWQYVWSSSAGNLSDLNESATLFTAPAGEESVTVSIQVTDDRNCVAEASKVIDIVSQLTPTVPAVATAVPTATVPPTKSPTATLTPTTKPSPTSAPTETETPTASPTTPPPSATPRPTNTPTPIPVPVITRLEVVAIDTLVIAWTWSGTLTADQHFAIRLWNVADGDPNAHNSRTWVKENYYQLKINNAEFPAGEYVLNIAVVEGPSFDHHEVVVQTENHTVYLPNIEPTSPPPCPPVCTDP